MNSVRVPGKPFAPRVWIPGLVWVLSMGAGLALLRKDASATLIGMAIALGILTTLYFVVQSAERLLKRQRWPAVFAGFRVLICGFGVLLLQSLYSVRQGDLDFMYEEHEDTFAKNLKIPTDLPIHDPAETDLSRAAENDPFQKALRRSLNIPPEGPATVSTALPSLRKLATENRPLLLRYLASHPAWRVFEEHKKLYATRRWQTGPHWVTTLHGYYGLQGEGPAFQTRTTIDLDAETWVGHLDHATARDEGSGTYAVKLRKANEMDESLLILRSGSVWVEVFEQSSGKERRLTKAALSALESEFAPLTQPGARAYAPVTIRSGKPSLKLIHGMQPGIFNFEAWVNPGEPGTVYLRAYEITQGTRLSEETLFERTNERTGWSAQKSELFYANGNFTIYEGDWGQPYAARFELWFRPETGAPERKLIEENFKIEGWQR